MFHTMIAMTILMDQAQSRFNLCVFEKEKSDCNELSTAGQCDAFLSKTMASISPVFDDLIDEENR